MAYYTAGIIGSYFRGGTTPAGFDISGSTVTAINLLASSTIRDTTGNLDISGGNITVTGTINAGSIASSGITPTNIIVPGYVRNALTPTTLDISGGNISNSGTTRTANAIVSGYVRNALVPTQFDISGGNISNSGTHISSNFIGTSTASNQIGGVTLSNFDISMASTGRILAPILRNAGTPTTYDISGGNISNSGVHTTAGLVGTYLRNALTPTTYDISGGNIMHTGQLFMNSGDGEKIQFTLFGSNATRITQSSGWILGIHSGSNGSDTGVIRFTRGATTGGGSAETMRIDATGQVGIGTSAPATILDISGRGTGFVTAQIRNTAGQAGLQITGGGAADNSGIQIWQTSTEQAVYNNNLLPFSIWTNNTRRMTFLSNGNVGIGTTDPSFALDAVSTNAQATGVFRNSSAAQAAVWVTSGLGVAYSAGLELYHDPSGSGTQGLYTANSTPLTFWTANGRRMTILSNGNVGINCNAPQNQLDICASGTFDGIRITAPGPVINMYVRGSEANGNTMQFFANSSNGGLHQFDSTRTLNFLTNSTSRMAIGTNGFVAIGTSFSNPAYRLDVSETSTVASINMSTWPRMNTISNVLISIGTINRATNVMNWNIPTLTMNTNLLTFVNSNTTNGGYFVILKSGMWSIKSIVTNQDAAQYTSLDASTNSTFNAHILGPGCLAQAHTAAYGDVTYVGYLSSNSGMYYKVVSPGGQGSGTPNNNKLIISFLYEMPDVSPTFPPP